ncbi:MAG TPA: adenylyl-sulfate kinase [Chitinolyticbacter sp.]|nr:adenylyl-sulfate kinase [Chitinolyticbacter sp.]
MPALPPALLFTGLPGAGKSTLAFALAAWLERQGRSCRVLDGDMLRAGPCVDLGYTDADRLEQARRAGAMAAGLRREGHIVLLALVTPLAAHRAALRSTVGNGLIEVWCNPPRAICEARDPKGLYAAARAGTLRGLTGIDAPYEAPESALMLDTDALALETCLARLLAHCPALDALP